MIRALPAGDAAVLVELADPTDPDYLDHAADLPATAARLASAIRAARLPGVLDVIPAACTVLVTLRPGSDDVTRLGRDLLSVEMPPRGVTARAPVIDIPVRYDGPDLADVAALTGLTPSEVIARHQAAEYEVGWLGFSPGFGYLTGLDSALQQVPRLDTPRLTVPTGSVAIAGGLAAVYPAESPGGWRLLGRTTTRLWDAARPSPALLEPGMRVRFRAVSDLPASSFDASEARLVAETWAASVASGAGRLVEVLQPGPLTTVQDLGRPGLGHLGVPGSGAADTESLGLANTLAGNEPDAACLEITLGRLVLRFDSDAVCALTGAPAEMSLTGADGTLGSSAPGTAFAIPAGAVLRLRAPRSGLRSYLAVDGGFETAATLGSRSADLLSRLGPAPLRAGDLLALGPRSEAQPGPEPGARRPAPQSVDAVETEIELTVVAGPRDDWFTESALDTLISSGYQITAASNRTGLRLAGPKLARRVVAELPSEGVAGGSLQVSHDGQPILLLADHPTTGGYPVIAVVTAADINRAAQLRPGQVVRFSLAR